VAGPFTLPREPFLCRCSGSQLWLGSRSLRSCQSHPVGEASQNYTPGADNSGVEWQEARSPGCIPDSDRRQNTLFDARVNNLHKSLEAAPGPNRVDGLTVLKNHSREAKTFVLRCVPSHAEVLVGEDRCSQGIGPRARPQLPLIISFFFFFILFGAAWRPGACQRGRVGKTLQRLQAGEDATTPLKHENYNFSDQLSNSALAVRRYSEGGATNPA
jgi:hypothetical protein